MCFCLWIVVLSEGIYISLSSVISTSRYFSYYSFTYIKEIPPRARSSGSRYRFHRSSPFSTSTYFSNYSFTKITENTLSRSTAARRHLCAQLCKSQSELFNHMYNLCPQTSERTIDTRGYSRLWIIFPTNRNIHDTPVKVEWYPRTKDLWRSERLRWS